MRIGDFTPDDYEAVPLLVKHFARHPGIDLVLQPSTAFALLGNLQLALRHPKNNGRAGAIVEQVKERLIEGLAAGDAEIERILRLGDDPQFDVPPHPDLAERDSCNSGAVVVIDPANVLHETHDEASPAVAGPTASANRATRIAPMGPDSPGAGGPDNGH